jgi:hypothetical protein
MANRIVQKVERVARRFLSAPFENLPSEFGDSVPPELRVFEAEAEASQTDVREEIVTPAVHDHSSKPARRDETLERR